MGLQTRNNRPPAILLGGADNALSITRSLGKYGVDVFVAAKPAAAVRSSRFCKGFLALRDDEEFDDLWHRALQKDELYGGIVLSCSDDAISFVARNRKDYEGHFKFEENRPELQLKLLDKQATIELARSAGIDAPAVYATADGISDLDYEKIRYPILVKPIHSHLYTRQFGDKLRLFYTQSELEKHLDEVQLLNMPVMLCEFIPGADDLLCSYYSYFDENGSPLFHYTKRVIRRHPENFGTGCYHIADHVPEAIDAGLRFFRSIDFRGLANVEFKLDPRDGRLKLIEANARFTAAQELLVRCGIDTARIVYDRLAKNPVRIPQQVRANRRLWFPMQDFAAFRALWRKRQMSLWKWLLSIAHRQTFPKFDLLDPMPAFAGALRHVRRRLRFPA